MKKKKRKMPGLIEIPEELYRRVDPDCPQCAAAIVVPYWLYFPWKPLFFPPLRKEVTCRCMTPSRKGE